MPARVGLAVFAVTALCYVVAAAPVPLYSKGEGREAMVVRAVLDGHGIVLPRRDGREMPSKPPLYHWLAALAARAGVAPAELAMRLPSILLGAAGAGACAALATAAHGATAGVLAGAVLASSLEWMRGATESRVDMTLAACLLAAVLAWRAGIAGDGRRGLVRLGWLAAVLAVLAKGPVGFVLPVLVVGAEALVAREPRRVLRLLDVPGMAAAALLAGGWYVAAWRVGGDEFLARQLLHENLARFAGGKQASHAKGPLYYIPALAGGFVPWTLALPVVVAHVRRRWTAEERGLLAWIGAVLVFYSAASGKRAAYLLPLYPPLALLTGPALAGMVRRPATAWSRAALLVVTAALALVALAVVVGFEARIVAALTPLLSGSDRANLPVTLEVVAAQRTGLALVLGGVAVCLAALATRTGTRAVGAGAALAAVAVLWTVGFARFGTYPFAERLTPRPFAARVHALLGPDDRLCAHGYVDFPVRWYLDRPLQPCSSPEHAGRTFVLRAATSGPLKNPCLRRVIDDGPGLELVEQVAGCRRAETR